MGNEAYITQVRCDMADEEGVVPSITAYDFITDPDHPTITTSAVSPSEVKTYTRWNTKIVIRDEDTKATVATSSDPWISAAALSAVMMSNCIEAAICKYWMGSLTLSDTDKEAAYDDTDFRRLLEALEVADMPSVKYEAGQVSTSLAAWDATLKNIVETMAQDWIDAH